MTHSSTIPPGRIPGYDGGPLAHAAELLDEPLFWLGHLSSFAQHEETAELLFGADFEAAEDFHRSLRGRAIWPAFAVPVAAGHHLCVVYRNLAGDQGTDYLLHHPGGERAELLASDDGHFIGPGLAWSEVTAAADNGLPDGSTDDPHGRLLLLLPALGDASLPADAAEHLAAALHARTAVEAPDQLADALLEDQGPCGRAHWTITADGLRINDGDYSCRNPANRFALPRSSLARVTAALGQPVR